MGDGEVVRGDYVFAVAIGRQVRWFSRDSFIHPPTHSFMKDPRIHELWSLP